MSLAIIRRLARQSFISLRAIAGYQLFTPGGSGGVWRTGSLFRLYLQYFANTYGFYFFITWLPVVSVEIAPYAEG
jgi:hypothetical protein